VVVCRDTVAQQLLKSTHASRDTVAQQLLKSTQAGELF